MLPRRIRKFIKITENRREKIHFSQGSDTPKELYNPIQFFTIRMEKLYGLYNPYNSYGGIVRIVQSIQSLQFLYGRNCMDCNFYNPFWFSFKFLSSNLKNSVKFFFVF